MRNRLTERDLSRIVRRVIREGIKSNKRELDMERKLDDIFFRTDDSNIFSEPGEWGYLSSQHSLKKKVSPRQRIERIQQVIDGLKDYIKYLEQTKFSEGVWEKNPDYDKVWSSLESDDYEEDDYRN